MEVPFNIKSAKSQAKYTTKIIKVGNSNAVYIPSNVIKEFKLKEKDEIDVILLPKTLKIELEGKLLMDIIYKLKKYYKSTQEEINDWLIGVIVTMNNQKEKNNTDDLREELLLKELPENRKRILKNYYKISALVLKLNIKSAEKNLKELEEEKKNPKV